MRVHLDPGAAESCLQACSLFEEQISKASRAYSLRSQSSSSGSFETARQLGTVYTLFVDQDLATLLDGFASQARAMSMLFAAAGGLIEAQDEALAGALSKAAEEPAGLQSLGLIHASESDGFILEDSCVMGGYGRVGPEDVSDSPLERIASCAQALQPDQFDEISARATAVSEVLESAATQLQADLDNVLGSGWQGEFAASAQDSVRGLVTSAVALSGELGRVAAKAQRAQEGFAVTRTNIAEQAMQAKAAELSGREPGPAGLPAAARAQAQRHAAEEQARAIVNTEYSPAVMDANLDDLDFTAAYRVVSTSALGGPGGIDMARIWNTEGITRPAQPAAPDPATLAAFTGVTGATGAEPSGPTGGAAGGAGATTSLPGPARDAATDQALLAARSGAADGGGPAAAVAGQPGAGQAGAGGGINATTTAAAAPMAPVTGTAGQPAGGAGAGGIRGLRGGTESRGRDRGFGSTAGLVGGGGAAAAGAGASRMGGAGTLAGYAAGGPAGPGTGGPTAGVPGTGSAPGGTAGPGPGTMGSSSSTSTANGPRAGAMPMGAMMGAAGAGQNSDRRGHTPAGYLTNATNTTAIIGDPVKVAPAVLGRTVDEPAQEGGRDGAAPYRGRTLGRDYTGGGAKGP